MYRALLSFSLFLFLFRFSEHTIWFYFSDWYDEISILGFVLSVFFVITGVICSLDLIFNFTQKKAGMFLASILLVGVAFLGQSESTAVFNFVAGLKAVAKAKIEKKDSGYEMNFYSDSSFIIRQQSILGSMNPIVGKWKMKENSLILDYAIKTSTLQEINPNEVFGTRGFVKNNLLILPSDTLTWINLQNEKGRNL